MPPIIQMLSNNIPYHRESKLLHRSLMTRKLKKLNGAEHSTAMSSFSQIMAQSTEAQIRERHLGPLRKDCSHPASQLPTKYMLAWPLTLLAHKHITLHS